MPGFGSGPFGSGPFGRHDWSKHVLWSDLPDPDRRLDSTVGEGRLEKFIDSIRPSFDFLRAKAADFGSLRDPDTVRTQFNERLDVEILASEAMGRVIRVTLDDPDTADLFVPMGEASVGWILRDSAGREYRVNEVHKPATLDVVGLSDLPSVGNATLRPPSLIEYLGSDYGIDVDFHEPEAFQRSSVKNAVQWLDLKGSVKSYDILGKISGYRVTPLGLWSIDSPTFDGIDPDRIHELPVGSGSYYTDVDPLRPNFDEVPADVIPLDTFCFETENTADGGTWDSNAPYVVPSGTTLSDAIGYPMLGTPILSTTNLGGGRWRLEVGPAADLSRIGWVGQWYALAAGMPGSRMYLETNPVETSSGVWTFEVMAGTAPTFGATVDLGYQCREAMDCGFCRASVIRVEVVPTEVSSDPDALLAGVLTRLVKKILQVVPAHVRITDIVHIVGPIEVSLDLMVTGSASALVVAYGPLGYYYDAVPADELPVDPDHMVVTGTAFTVP